MSVYDDLASLAVSLVQEMIENDLRALGVTMETAGDYTVIWQRVEASEAAVYRGIAHKGKVIWDKHPDWPKIQL